MQNESPNYQTPQQQQGQSHPDDGASKAGSARPDTDPIDAVAGPGPVAVPTELIAAEHRPVEFVPREALPIETQPTDIMTPEGRPFEFRPH